MLIPLGYLSASGGSGGAVFELISTQVLASTATTVTFSSIPTIYKHLQIRMTARGAGANTQDNYRIVLNGDTTATYAYHTMFATGTATNASAQASTANAYGPYMPGNSATANFFGASIIDILDFANTNKTKTIRHFGGNSAGAGASEVDFYSNHWNSTAAITSIQFNLSSGSSYAINSRFSLYGVKG